MVQGFWKIPVPAEGPEVMPDVTLAPVVGWDAAGFGWAMAGAISTARWPRCSPRPSPSASGCRCRAGSPTIFPQPHDIAMDDIVTEAGRNFPQGLSPR